MILYRTEISDTAEDSVAISNTFFYKTGGKRAPTISIWPHAWCRPFKKKYISVLTETYMDPIPAVWFSPLLLRTGQCLCSWRCRHHNIFYMSDWTTCWKQSYLPLFLKAVDKIRLYIIYKKGESKYTNIQNSYIFDDIKPFNTSKPECPSLESGWTFRSQSSSIALQSTHPGH